MKNKKNKKNKIKKRGGAGGFAVKAPGTSAIASTGKSKPLYKALAKKVAGALRTLVFKGKPSSAPKPVLTDSLVNNSIHITKIGHSPTAEGGAEVSSDVDQQQQASKQLLKDAGSLESPNKKTVKEILKQLFKTDKYSSTTDRKISTGAFSVTDQSSPVENNQVQRSSSRATATCTVDAHQMGDGAPINGSGTIHSMMPPEMFIGDTVLDAKILGEFETALEKFAEFPVDPGSLNAFFEEAGFEGVKCTSSTDDLKTQFSQPTASKEQKKQKANIFNAVVTLSRGLTMLEHSKSQESKGDPPIVLRRGFLNPTKAKSSIDGDEKRMLDSENAFSKFVQKNSEALGGVQYSYTNTNVQKSTSDPIHPKAIKIMSDLLPTGGDELIKSQAEDALTTLKESEDTLELLNAQETFDRCLMELLPDQTSKVNHCKSGKDRTGALAYNTLVNTDTLTQLNTMASGHVFSTDSESEPFEALKNCKDYLKSEQLVSQISDPNIKSGFEKIISQGKKIK
mgnify:CR=1 FL=1